MFKPYVIIVNTKLKYKNKNITLIKTHNFDLRKFLSLYIFTCLMNFIN